MAAIFPLNTFAAVEFEAEVDAERADGSVVAVADASGVAVRVVEFEAGNLDETAVIKQDSSVIADDIPTEFGLI